MENKINIAELLKDCPKGMELNCTMYENVEFDYIEQNSELVYPIHCLMKINGGYNDLVFTHNGCNDRHPNAKCVIFPKGKTTWEGFRRPFKDGDIIYTHANCLKVGVGNTWISIYQENRNGGVATYVDYAEDGSDYYSNIDGDKAFLCMEKDILRQRLATEEEKQKLFQAIKDNGYHWNEETKTLEKLVEPKFKVGDSIQSVRVNLGNIYNVIEVKESLYVVNKNNENSNFHIDFDIQDDWELVPNKFDITTLKAFESRVLVRDYDNRMWIPTFWGKLLEDDSNCSYLTTNGCYKYCIPYDGNQHLLGTTNDCDDFYKTWE